MKSIKARDHIFPPRSRVVLYPNGDIAAVITSTRRPARFTVLVDSGYVIGGANLRRLLDAARDVNRTKKLTLQQWSMELGLSE